MMYYSSFKLRYLYSMKIKKQTRKLAAGSSKHSFEIVDRTDETSSKYCFEVADGSWRGLKKFSKSINLKMTYKLK